MTKKILLLLPCNKYAKEGNYYKGKSWRVALKWLKALGLRDKVFLGAIDSIPLKHNLGDCIVLEDEMHRVRGFDEYPKYDDNIIMPLAECIKKGLMRVLNRFEKIIILLNVPLYKKAAHEALKMLSGEKIVMIKVEDNRPGMFYRKIIKPYMQ